MKKIILLTMVLSSIQVLANNNASLDLVQRNISKSLRLLNDAQAEIDYLRERSARRPISLKDTYNNMKFNCGEENRDFREKLSKLTKKAVKQCSLISSLNEDQCLAFVQSDNSHFCHEQDSTSTSCMGVCTIKVSIEL